MSSGLQGSDPEELRAFAHDLDLAQDVLLRIKGELGTRISSNLRWEGPDAFFFKHAWQSSYAPVLAKAAAMLAETARTLRAQAAEQDSASR